MPAEYDFGPGLFPPSAVEGAGSRRVDEQLALIGEPTPVRIPAVEWLTWLADESVRARYWAKVYRTSSGEDCWFFLGGISSTGHASFRAASRPGRTRTGTVPGHLYGYQLAHGVIPRLGWGTTAQPSATPATTTPASNQLTCAWAPRRRTEPNGWPAEETPAAPSLTSAGRPDGPAPSATLSGPASQKARRRRRLRCASGPQRQVAAL